MRSSATITAPTSEIKPTTGELIKDPARLMKYATDHPAAFEPLRKSLAKLSGADSSADWKAIGTAVIQKVQSDKFQAIWMFAQLEAEAIEKLLKHLAVAADDPVIKRAPFTGALAVDLHASVGDLPMFSDSVDFATPERLLAAIKKNKTATARKAGIARHKQTAGLKTAILEAYKIGKWISKRDAASKLMAAFKKKSEYKKWPLTGDEANQFTTIYGWLRKAK